MPLRTTVTVNLSVPVELAEALDDHVVRRQAANPDEYVTRSKVAVEAFESYLALERSQQTEE